jgi:hypothetical protein
MDVWIVEVFLSRFITIIADSKGCRLFIADSFSCYFSPAVAGSPLRSDLMKSKSNSWHKIAQKLFYALE